MTTCAECLSELSSARLSEIRSDSPTALHYSRCENCRRVAEDLFYAETRLANALAEVSPYTGSAEVAAVAVVGSERLRRKRIARWVRGVLLVVGAGVFGAAMEARTEGESPPTAMLTETITLSCAQPEAAIAIATGYLSASGSVVYRSDESRTLTLRGDPGEVMAARRRIVALDGSCPTPPPPDDAPPPPEPPPAGGGSNPSAYR